jgi:hypothetical protein
VQSVLEAFHCKKERFSCGLDWRGKAMIDKKYLKSLKPCADRFENYLQHYADWSGSLSEFLALENISHRDKTWVLARSISTKNKQLFAIEMAENVLYLFELQFPYDKRPREAISAAKLILKGSLSKHEATAAADTAHAVVHVAHAAHAADAAYAAYAAYAAHATAYAAYADHAAAYAVVHAAYAAYAAHAAACAYNDSKALNAQIEIMKKYAESEK